jgi:thioredoxin 1
MRIIDQEAFANEILQDKTDMIYLVDFFAEWCGPCKMLSPVLEQVQSQYEGKITIVKLDIDANQELTEELQIMSIPTVMVYRNWAKLETINGLKWLEFRPVLVDSFLMSSVVVV